MSNIEKLIISIEKEAKKELFPLDISVYQKVGKEPTKPIVYCGNLKSNICVMGRDLGRDEVKAGQPLIGAAGRQVREGFYQLINGKNAESDQELESIKERLILTNTVPYKPPENKAYSMKVKERFRPFIEQLLVIYWQGKQIITLGTEACKWFSAYMDKESFNVFWNQGDSRYENSFTITLNAYQEGNFYQKEVTIYPLPHPSPLNVKYYQKFPMMLINTLNKLDF